jgi:hypothetical protein
VAVKTGNVDQDAVRNEDPLVALKAIAAVIGRVARSGADLAGHRAVGRAAADLTASNSHAGRDDQQARASFHRSSFATT